MELPDDKSVEVSLHTRSRHASSPIPSSSTPSRPPAHSSTVQPLSNSLWPTGATWFDPDVYLQQQPHAFRPPDGFGVMHWPGTATIGSPLAQHFVLAPTAADTAAQTEPMLVPTAEYVHTLESRLAYAEGLCGRFASDLVAVQSRLHILEIANDLSGPPDGQPDAEPNTAFFMLLTDIANVENRVLLGMPASVASSGQQSIAPTPDAENALSDSSLPTAALPATSPPPVDVAPNDVAAGAASSRTAVACRVPFDSVHDTAGTSPGPRC